MKKSRNYRNKIIAHNAWKHFIRRCQTNKKKKVQRRAFQSKTKKQINEIRFKQKEAELIRRTYRDYNHIEAPVCLSMIENTEGTLDFISKLESSLAKKERVFVVLRNVEKIASGAIVVLLSIMIKFKNHNVDFNGNHPKNLEAKTALLNSGFFEHLYETDGDHISLKGHKNIFTHANKTVDSELSDSLISTMSTFIWGMPFRCPGVQRVYLELMQNTNNHASLNGPNEHHWYTTVFYNEKKNKACFSFIDYGVGIIESINRNKKGKFWTSLTKIFSILKPKNNGDFLRLILDGSVHQTATGHYYRGKGLPGIYKAFLDNKISNLIIIANDAIADCENKVFKKLNTKFDGTYVYWELNENNKKVES